jgi:hypothetical protein
MGFFNKLFKSNNKKSSSLVPTMEIRMVGTRKFNFEYKEAEHYYQAYKNIPQIRAVIDSSAKAFARGKFEDTRMNADGEIEIDRNSDLIQAFRRPHPLLTEKEFLEALYKNWQLFDIVYIVKNIPVGFAIKGMFVLPSKDVKIVPKENIGKDLFYATEIDEVIKGYELTFNDQIITFKPNDIWMISNSSLRLEEDGYLYPEYKMRSLKEPIKIIAASYEIDLELKINHGAIGIISPDGKDGQGEVLPLTKKSKKSLQEDYGDYGLTREKWKLIIADAALKFSPISLPVKDLELSEGIEDQKRIIADVFTYPYELMANVKGTTFSNKKESREMLYTEKIIPEWEIIQESANYEFKLNEDEDRELRINYSHIEATQGDREEKARTNKITIESVLEVNNKISENVIDQEIGINILVYTYEIPRETAKGLLTDVAKIGQNGQDTNQTRQAQYSLPS